jgi:hypothetical protein
MTKEFLVVYPKTSAGKYIADIMRRDYGRSLEKKREIVTHIRTNFFGGTPARSLAWKALESGQGLWRPLNPVYLRIKQEMSMDTRIWRATGQVIDVLSGRYPSAIKESSRVTKHTVSVTYQFKVVDTYTPYTRSKLYKSQKKHPWRKAYGAAVMGLPSYAVTVDEGAKVGNRTIPPRPFALGLIKAMGELKDRFLFLMKKILF